MAENLSLPIDIKPFRARTEDAWASFLVGEGELRALMEQKSGETVRERLVGRCSALLSPTFSEKRERKPSLQYPIYPAGPGSGRAGRHAICGLFGSSRPVGKRDPKPGRGGGRHLYRWGHRNHPGLSGLYRLGFEGAAGQHRGGFFQRPLGLDSLPHFPRRCGWDQPKIKRGTVKIPLMFIQSCCPECASYNPFAHRSRHGAGSCCSRHTGFACAIPLPHPRSAASWCCWSVVFIVEGRKRNRLPKACWGQRSHPRRTSRRVKPGAAPAGRSPAPPQSQPNRPPR